jgi:hypothetical protein
MWASGEPKSNGPIMDRGWGTFSGDKIS